MVFVTGGAGFIGSHTCLELLKAGREVLVADNLCNSHASSLERVERLAGKKLSFVRVDVCDREALERIFSEYDIDSVIHFAGLKAVGESVGSPVEYFSNNLGSTLSLCSVMRAHDVNRIVFSSSATVYSGSFGVPSGGFSESSPTGECTNPYGWTKFMSEKILSSVCVANPDFSAVLLRYFNPIGADPSGEIGEDPEGVPNNLMPYITQVASGVRERLTIFGNDYDTPDGTGVRDYIHVSDLARAHIKALEFVENNTGCEVFNIGTGRGTSVLELVRSFEEVNGVAVPYVVGARRPGDLGTVFANVSKAERLLGFRAEFGIRDMCRDAWNFQKRNPHGIK